MLPRITPLLGSMLRRKPDVGKVRGSLPNREAVQTFELASPSFPIDVVYTWVDGSDPAHLESVRKFKSLPAADASERFQDHEELRFSLRSLEAFAPWVNHIYIVTNGQQPHWLVQGPKLSVITHDRILPPDYLPTFNSHAIESALHRIPGLAEHYIYFNDDVLLCRPMEERDFFTAGGLLYGMLSSAILPNRAMTGRDLESVCAQKNSQRLIFQEWGVWFDRRFKHTYHPQRRSVGEDVERRFQTDVHRTRSQRFRSPEDVAICTTLNSAAAYLTGKGLLRANRSYYLPIRDRSISKLYEQVLASRDSRTARDSMCLNASFRGTPLRDYAGELRRFLVQYFPNPSSFEVSDDVGSN